MILPIYEVKHPFFILKFCFRSKTKEIKIQQVGHWEEMLQKEQKENFPDGFLNHVEVTGEQ